VLLTSGYLGRGLAMAGGADLDAGGEDGGDAIVVGASVLVVEPADAGP